MTEKYTGHESDDNLLPPEDELLDVEQARSEFASLVSDPAADPKAIEAARLTLMEREQRVKSD